MAVYGTVAYSGSNNKTAGFDLRVQDSYTDVTNSLALHGTEISAGWVVTAAPRGRYLGVIYFVSTTVQSVAITYDTSSPPAAIRIDITLVGSFNASDLQEADLIMYCFTPPAPPSGGVACFVAGTRVLTADGYKAVETLTQADKIVTSEGREVAAKVYTFELPYTDTMTAPYRIEAGAFGRNLPAAPIALSPVHKIQFRPHMWTCPRAAATFGNSRVKQYGVGEPIRYYHIECENFLRDNIVTEGLIVESLGHEGRYKGVNVYTWSKRFQGYTRISADTKIANK